MYSKTYDTFLDALAKIVGEKRPYKDKAAALAAHMTEGDRANLEELASWFPSED